MSQSDWTLPSPHQHTYLHEDLLILIGAPAGATGRLVIWTRGELAWRRVGIFEGVHEGIDLILLQFFKALGNHCILIRLELLRVRHVLGPHPKYVGESPQKAAAPHVGSRNNAARLQVVADKLGNGVVNHEGQDDQDGSPHERSTTCVGSEPWRDFESRFFLLLHCKLDASGTCVCAALKPKYRRRFRRNAMTKCQRRRKCICRL